MPSTLANAIVQGLHPERALAGIGGADLSNGWGD